MKPCARRLNICFNFPSLQKMTWMTTIRYGLRSILRTGFAALMLAAPLSCTINRDYDFKKGVDTNVVLAKNLVVPIGNAGSIDADKSVMVFGYDAVSYDEDGNIVLDFTSGEEISFQFDIDGLNVNLNQELSKKFSFLLEMDVANSSPFSYGVSVALLDSLDNVVEAYHPIVSGVLPAGSPEVPVISPLSIDVTADRLSPFDCIRFTLTLYPESLAGQKYTLSEDDQLVFNNLRISLPEGVPVDMAWLKKVMPYLRIIGFLLKKS